MNEQFKTIIHNWSRRVRQGRRMGCGENQSYFHFATLVDPNTEMSDRINIGEGFRTIIGAGAVVIRDIESGVTAVGNPINIIKYHEKPRGGYFKRINLSVHLIAAEKRHRRAA